MAEKKTWADIHKDEVLSDNSGIESCKQCKNCIFRNGGTLFSNHYTKSNCQIYQYPGIKPLEVINNLGKCAYYRDD